jgi:hypothetical protein
MPQYKQEAAEIIYPGFTIDRDMIDSFIVSRLRADSNRSLGWQSRPVFDSPESPSSAAISLPSTNRHAAESP